MVRLPPKESLSAADSVLCIASTLSQKLDDDPSDPTICKEARNGMSSLLTLPTSNVQSDKVKLFDEHGTFIWNISTRLGRIGATSKPPQTYSLIRAFAFLLLDFAHRTSARHGKQATDSRARVFRLALKAAKPCIEHGLYDICTNVFQKAADYEAAINHGDRRSPQGQEEEPVDIVLRHLAAEYWLLRAMLSWKQGRLDIADSFLKKVALRYEDNDQIILAEKYADLTYEIGKALLGKEQYLDSIPWLEKSSDTLEHIEGEKLSPDATELRLSAVHDLTKSLLGIGDTVSLTRAADLIAFLEVEYTDKMAILMLRIKLLSVHDPVPVEEYQRVVMRMITKVVMTEGNFKTIMQQIQKMGKLKPAIACKTLESFLSVRLYEAANTSWTQKALLTRTWMSSLLTPTMQERAQLQSLFDEVYEAGREALGSDAAHAALTLLWKVIEKLQESGEDETAEAWCCLAGHGLFANGGEINKSKLTRKMISSALARNDIAAAREAYFRLSETAKAAPITRYLMYKVALRSGDDQLAADSLEAVCRNAGQDSTYLYACVLEAQQHGNRQQAVMALLKIVESCIKGSATGVYLPAVLRCTIRLIMTETKEQTITPNRAIPEICKVFEAAAVQNKHFRRPPSEKTKPDEYKQELRWFAKTTYNMAVEYVAHADVHPDLVVRLLTCCILFITLLQEETAEQGDQTLGRRKALCHFLAASSLIVQARAEDNTESSFQYYLEARKHVASFQDLFSQLPKANTGDDASANTLDKKHTELLRFDLEAVVRLQTWDDLDRVLDKCIPEHQDIGHMETMADLILTTHQHIIDAKLAPHYHQKIPFIMDRLINQSWKTYGLDVRKLARWIRCVFRMTLSLHPEISLRCLDNAKKLAETFASAPNVKAQYPQDELEWLASTAFNHAVDLYCASDEEGCRTWAEKALNLAMASPSRSGVHAAMQGSWMKLNLKE